MYQLYLEILDFVNDHYNHFKCYPQEVEAGGRVYTWNEYWEILDKEGDKQ